MFNIVNVCRTISETFLVVYWKKIDTMTMSKINLIFFRSNGYFLRWHSILQVKGFVTIAKKVATNKWNPYFSGGWPSMSSIEYIDKFSDSWVLFEKDGRPKVRHCMVTLDNGNFVLIGGHQHGFEVTMFDVMAEKWKFMANLTIFSDRYQFMIFMS